MAMYPVEKPLVLVTGGSRGIGSGACILLASLRYDVVFNYQSNKNAAEQVVNDINLKQNGRSVAFQEDVCIQGGRSKEFI